MKKNIIVLFLLIFCASFSIAQTGFVIDYKKTSIESFVEYKKYQHNKKPDNIKINCIAINKIYNTEIYLVIIKENNQIIQYSEVNALISDFNSIELIDVSKLDLESFIKLKNYKKL